MHIRNHQTRPGSDIAERGFTLLEVLIALVVLSVGMLGIAVLYVEGLKAERTSVFRTSAVNLVAGMSDRVRANPDGALAYTGGAADNGCTNGVVDCTPEQIAQEDLWWWDSEIGHHLPAGAAGAVRFLPNGFTDRYTVSVTWSEAGFPTPQSFSVTFEL